MEEIEQELGIETCPVNWPIGSGKRFAGVYERNDQEVIRFIPVDGGKKEVETEILKAGQAHYCPKGHKHGMKNEGTEDLIIFGVVPKQ